MREAASDNQRITNSKAEIVRKSRTVPESLQLATTRARAVAKRELLRERETRAHSATAPIFVRLSMEEQNRLALPVLEAARRLVVVDGLEPLDAIATAGNARIESEYARRVLREDLSTSNLLAWQESTPRQSDRTRALDRAIRRARRAFGHKGGWRVSASVPPDRQHLEWVSP